MKVTSSSAFRRSLASMIDMAADDHEPLLITRTGSKPAAILMSLEDFASYDETDYLLSSPSNAESLRESIRELDAGGGAERKLIE